TSHGSQTVTDIIGWRAILEQHPYFVEFFHKTNKWLRDKINDAEIEVEVIQKLRIGGVVYEQQQVLRQGRANLPGRPISPVLVPWGSSAGELE
ncbi:hypothetical protein DXG01_011172, partial [Tephrocybe rancida]